MIANGYASKLEIGNTQGMLTGNEARGTFDGGGTWNQVITRTRSTSAMPEASSAREQHLKLMETIPSANSGTLRRNLRTDLTMNTTFWDRIPYFMAPPCQFDHNLSHIERACLAADAKGSSGRKIDNFALFDLFDPAGTPQGAGVIGGHQDVSQSGRWRGKVSGIRRRGQSFASRHQASA